MNEHNSNSKLRKRKIGYHVDPYFTDSVKSIPIETKKDDWEIRKKFKIEKKEKSTQANGKKLLHPDHGEVTAPTHISKTVKRDNFSTPCHGKGDASSSTYGNGTKSIQVSQDTMERSSVRSPSPKPNFQSTGVDVYQFAESRAYEVMNLRLALNTACFMERKRVFQNLPRHMRRRAASHDIKRIPRRLQDKAMKEKVVPKKPPSRKYKRRPHNLMEEYNRRSRQHSWLETHMWHAKRFKMMDKWGYRLPMRPSGKSFRALFRASAKSCLLQDKSYNEVIEIIGRRDDIVEGFGRITSTDCCGGISWNSDKCMSTRYYSEETIFVHDAYPYKVIGPARFIWTRDGETDQCKLFLIIHPSICEQLLKELSIVFGNSDNLLDVDSSRPLHNDQTKRCSELADAKNTDNDMIRSEKESERVVVICHKLDFVLLSLTGPLSAQLLQNVLRLDSKAGETDRNENNTCGWNYCNPSEEGCKVYNISVEDPRFHLPHKKRNPFTTTLDDGSAEKAVGEKVSGIWEKSVREAVKKAKLTDHQINKMRQQQLVPASHLPSSSPQIPMVIMERAAEGKDAYGSGFDVLLPSGWGMPFWIALVYQGAHVGGVEADENIAFERMSPHFPTHYPDTIQYQEQARVLLKERSEKHSSHPPNKRINYGKLGFRNPFSISWDHLVSEWKHNARILMKKDAFSNGVNEPRGFYVLREKKLLSHLHKLLVDECCSQHEKEAAIQELLQHSDSFVPIILTPQGSGIPKENASICIPTKDDITIHEANVNNRDNQIGRYKEPCHKGRKKHFPYICKEHGILLPNAAVIGGNTRWILGHVQSGSYSFIRGRGSGIGFVSAVGLAYMLDQDLEFQLLFRNVNTFEYIPCSFDIFF